MRKIKIIAEMAWSHDGSYKKASKLIKAAKKSGADYFGIHITDMNSYMSIYYRNSPGKVSKGREKLNIYKYLEKINLKKNDWIRLKKTAKKIKIKLCVMANDENSLDFTINKIKPEMYALSAASFTELNMIKKIAKQKKKTVLRIGGATLNEIKEVIKIFKRYKNKNYILLHGIQVYPTSYKEINLNQLNFFKNELNSRIGLADHIDGSEDFAIFLPSLAIPFGIEYVEKHITLNRDEKSEDYESALDPQSFKKMANIIKLSNYSLGKFKISRHSNAEKKYRQISRKRTVAKFKILKGQKITNENTIFKRSDSGIEPIKLNKFIGKKVKKDIPTDYPITKIDLV